MSDVFSFDDLKPKKVIAKITTMYGKTLEIPVVPPTLIEWELEESRFPVPKIRHTKLAPDGVTMLPNPDDQSYIDDRNLRNRRTAAYHVAAAMERAGISVPGENARDKADEMCKVESGVLNSLVRLLYDTSVKGEKSRLEEVVDSFQHERVSQSNGASEVEVFAN